jgi:hypothetical protein
MLRASLLVLFVVTLVLSTAFQGTVPNLFNYVHAQPLSGVGAIAPSTNWGPLFGTSGDVQININRPGIAVRVEIPREFLQGVISIENDTSFIQTDIRNDFYYYNVVDESNHWTYAWRGAPSDGACFKPNFSLRDPNAPWCVEIWNYLDGKWLNFTAPKFIRFRNLSAPRVAGIYNFTLFVANRTNSIGYPDFVHAWNNTLFVPVSMSDDPATLTGSICDGDVSPSICPLILHDKGIVYARNVNTGQIARAFVNQTTGRFNVTGLAPGPYVVQASAGVVNGVAYSLSDPQPTQVSYGTTTDIGALHLHRAPQVCGQISYEKSPGNPLAHSFSDHPYLRTVLGSGPGLKLNITVEATDLQGHIYRYQNTSLDTSEDSFLITTGSNVTYVGTDPYGTEFAGLPPVTSGSYSLTVKVWITGYVQAFSETVTVSSAPGISFPIICNQVAPNPVVMLVGGIITGTIQLWNLVTTESPNQAEATLGVTSSELLFGGNILIEAYDHSGVLRGVVVNGTIPTLTGDVNSLRFYVIGFSDYANHTWSGVWNERDYGLPEDQAYSLQVFIRGYEQASTSVVSLLQGGNSTVTVRMVRGGLFSVYVGSYDNRFGTRAIQSQLTWGFLSLSIPVSARIYFYDSGGRTTGFAETLMATGIPDGVGVNSFTVLFSGQNWSIREIWFYGFVPTHITSDTYSIKAYTLGYVQLGPVNVPNNLTGFSPAAVELLIGNQIDITGPFFANSNAFTNTTEHDHAIGEAFGVNGLAGALPANVSANVPSLSLQISGFGAWENVTCTPAPCKSFLLGQGHFFYVSPDGSRFFDYGLDTGNYEAQIPEFGFNFHFMQTVPPWPVTFTDLSQQQGFALELLAMGRVIVGGGPNELVTGWVRSPGDTVVPLSWVQVQAISTTFSRSVPTLDGEYTGVGALFLPEGIYNINFTVAFYKPQAISGVFVGWGGSLSVLPPDGPLCPTGGIVGTCDPPTSSLHSRSQPLVSNSNMSTAIVVVGARAVTHAIILNGTQEVELAEIAINASSNGQMISYVAFNESVVQIDFDHGGAVELSANSSAKPTAVFADNRKLPESQSSAGLNQSRNAWVYDQNTRMLTVFADPSSITIFYGSAPTPVPEFPFAYTPLVFLAALAATILVARKTEPREDS